MKSKISDLPLFVDRALGEDEISNTQDPMVLFRGNTVATKCIDEFMKIAGGHYLHYTLKYETVSFSQQLMIDLT